MPGKAGNLQRQGQKARRVFAASTAGTTTAFRQPWWQKPPDPPSDRRKDTASTLWITGEERCREI